MRGGPASHPHLAPWDTLHLVPAEDVGRLTGLVGPAIVRSRGRRYRELGGEVSAGKQAVRVIEKSLASRGPLTRAEPGEAIKRSGLRIDVAGRALPHLIGRAALEGRLCHGPRRDGDENYVRLADWVPQEKPPGREESLAEPALRYLRAYGPATPGGFRSLVRPLSAGCAQRLEITGI